VAARLCRVTQSPTVDALVSRPTHHPAVIPSTTTLLTHPHSRPDILGVLVPFLCASGYALIFTSPLVLPTEDDSSDSKAFGEQQSQFASHQRRFVGSSEMERESSMRSHSSYHGSSPVPTNVVGSFPSFGHRYYPHQATNSVRCLQKVICAYLLL